jgi:single-strand DNA-binding protein
MTGFSKVILIGNLTKDPEVRYLPNGNPVATFGVAVNRKSKQGGETKEEVSFFDVVVYGKSAEHCGQYLNKGNGILVDGRLQQRRWDDKETGQKRSKIEIVAQNVQFLPKGAAPSPRGSEGQAEPLSEPTGGDEDIPF